MKKDCQQVLTVVWVSLRNRKNNEKEKKEKHKRNERLHCDRRVKRGLMETSS